MPSRPLRVAIVADLVEERWPSMDLVAEMLTAELKTMLALSGNIEVEMLRPSLARIPYGGPGPVRTIDRYVNRFWDYPRWLRGRGADFDLFHIVDHSYAHLVHELPPGRAIVTCHDADAFLPLVDSTLTGSKLPRMLTRRILSGLRKAAWVTCDSRATRDELRKYDLVATDRLTVVHNGVHPSYSAQANAAADATIDTLVGPAEGASVDLLHVGSCIERKRIDLLLQVFAAVRAVEPRARLLKAGGRLTGDQRALARRLGVESHIVQMPFLDAERLAALYRRATLALVTSSREGFGLPVVEAMACGTRVVVTDLPVLREVGGDAARYCPLDDVPRWCDTVVLQLREDERARAIARAACLAQATRFTWRGYATAMADLYHFHLALPAGAPMAS